MVFLWLSFAQILNTTGVSEPALENSSNGQLEQADENEDRHIKWSWVVRLYKLSETKSRLGPGRL